MSNRRTLYHYQKIQIGTLEGCFRVFPYKGPIICHYVFSLLTHFVWGDLLGRHFSCLIRCVRRSFLYALSSKANC